MSQNYSLTIRHIIDPVLTLCNTAKSEQEHTLAFFTRKELATRVMALFCSVFALLDTCRFLVAAAFHTGVHIKDYFSKKEVLKILINEKIDYPEKIKEDLERSAQFALITVIGSVCGVILPSVFNYFPHTKAPICFPQLEKKTAPEKVQKIIQTLLTSSKSFALSQFTTFWQTASLLEKSTFVRILDEGGEGYNTLRKTIAAKIYRKATVEKTLFDRIFTKEEEISWPSAKERGVISGEGEESALTHGVYFHSTSKEGLQKILQEGKIEPLRDPQIQAVPLTSTPDFTYGPYILALRRHVERHSKQVFGFLSKEKRYISCLKAPLPVNEDTLAYVIFCGVQKRAREQFQSEIETIAQRKIHVIDYSEAEKATSKLLRVMHLVPIEWQTPPEKTAQDLEAKLKRISLTQRAARI